VYNIFKVNQDNRELNIVKENIRPGDTVLDIGANIGFYTKQFSDMVGPQGKVFAFEPDPTNFIHLQDNCKHLTNVTLRQCAVSDRDGDLILYTSKKLNVDHRTYKPEEYDEEINIACISIDTFLADQKKVDFIKIDIQGFEVNAFRGMQNTLKNNPDVKILSELSPYDLKLAGSSTREFIQILNTVGLSCYTIKKSTYELIENKTIAELEKLDHDNEKYYNVLVKRG
jgi:FkbM family methyltransferase